VDIYCNLNAKLRFPLAFASIPGREHNPFKDRLEGFRKRICDKISQCDGSFAAVHLAGKRRHNKPIWCKDYGDRFLSQIAVELDRDKPMPEPKQDNSIELLPSDESERFYLEQFMRKFDAEWNGEAQVTAQTGHELLISRQLFTDHKTGLLKITKNRRERYVLFVADTIIKPDEIWLREGEHESSALYLLSRFQIKRDVASVLTVFRNQGKLWEGWTGYQSFDWNYFKTKRDGVLIYQR
jgi:hypothetical protein